MRRAVEHHANRPQYANLLKASSALFSDNCSSCDLPPRSGKVVASISDYLFCHQSPCRARATRIPLTIPDAPLQENIGQGSVVHVDCGAVCANGKTAHQPPIPKLWLNLPPKKPGRSHIEHSLVPNCTENSFQSRGNLARMATAKSSPRSEVGMGDGRGCAGQRSSCAPPPTCSHLFAHTRKKARSTCTSTGSKRRFCQEQLSPALDTSPPELSDVDRGPSEELLLFRRCAASSGNPCRALWLAAGVSKAAHPLLPCSPKAASKNVCVRGNEGSEGRSPKVCAELAFLSITMTTAMITRTVNSVQQSAEWSLPVWRRKNSLDGRQIKQCVPPRSLAA